jgi:hypothetical protein
MVAAETVCKCVSIFAYYIITHKFIFTIFKLAENNEAAFTIET